MARWATVAALAALAVGVVVTVGGDSPGDPGGEANQVQVEAADSVTVAPGAEAEPVGWVPDDPGDYLTYDGSTPDASPPTPLAVGPLVLDGPFSVAAGLFGPADSIDADLGGWLHQWALPGEAVIGVTMWEDDTFQIAGLHATVPAQSSTRLAMAGGTVLGASSVGELAAGLGGGFAPAEARHDDFVAMTVECVERFPVVVKIDAPGLRPATDMMDRQATAVMIGYADAAPGSPPCN